MLIVPPLPGDFERGRWFAGCFCWSTRAERVLDGQLDLPFLKTFGHSIMQEVARLDAMTTNQAKTTFLSSLSHELRTPLHGILGSVHLMRNSRLDSFQISMINSITICGRTLLETVEHLLDHAERPESIRHYSSTITHNDSNVSIACDKLSTESSPAERSESSKCNVGLVTEEVVETMIVGEAPFNFTLDANDDGDTSVDQTHRQAIAKKRSRFIILDISDYQGLGFRLSASSYGRIVMNLFGNALKFTESGYVHISVRSENYTDNTGFVVLKISDSGIGMNARFLEKAFEPFRKQNQYTAGTGVGLSVVRRILEDIGGRIDVSSKPSIGTDIVLKLPLERLSEEENHDVKINPLPVAMSSIKGRKACIMYTGADASDSTEQALHKKTLLHYVEVLAATLSNVLQLDLYHTSFWDGSDDTEVVICPEVSFEGLQMIRTSAAKAGRRCPATILIAMDVLEAETLRSDARVTSKESIVESVTQP
jgi:signal transduction histidine kinase